MLLIKIDELEKPQNALRANPYKAYHSPQQAVPTTASRRHSTYT